MDAVSLKNAALGLLARREHGTEELKRKLIAKYQPSTEDLAYVFSELARYNYLDDERFSHMYCRSRVNKGFGPERIIRDLGDKGINSELSNQAVNEIEDWVEHAIKVREKKFKTTPKDFKEKQKQMQFLRYRGFRFEEIEQAIKSNF